MDPFGKVSKDAIIDGFVKQFFKSLAKYIVEIPFKLFMFLVGEIYKLIKWAFVELCPRWLRGILGFIAILYIFYLISNVISELHDVNFSKELKNAITELFSKSSK